MKKSQVEKWKLEKSRTIYTNAWIRVREDQLLTEENRKITYSVIEFPGGVGVVVVENNQIYLVGQYRYTLQHYSWEIVKGSFNGFSSKETPRSAIKRELEEETGIRATKWKKIGFVNTLIGSTDDKVFLFLATGLKFGKSRPEDSEKISVRKVNFQEFEKMVKREEITDATSIAAYYLAKKELGKI